MATMLVSHLGLLLRHRRKDHSITRMAASPDANNRLELNKSGPRGTVSSSYTLATEEQQIHNSTVFKCETCFPTSFSLYRSRQRSCRYRSITSDH
jgi:hypothetical protein